MGNLMSICKLLIKPLYWFLENSAFNWDNNQKHMYIKNDRHCAVERTLDLERKHQVRILAQPFTVSGKQAKPYSPLDLLFHMFADEFVLPLYQLPHKIEHTDNIVLSGHAVKNSVIIINNARYGFN